ncbi:MAG TPA: hypothetical protein VF719_06965, partial [Abditibacteriaceae bacterium]
MNSPLQPPHQTPQSKINDLRTVLEPAIEVLESERRRVVTQTRNAAIISAIIAGGLLLVLLASGGNMAPFFFFIPIVIALIVVGIVYANGMSGYRSGFKTLVIPHIVRCCGEGLIYESNNYISENDFRACGLFRSPDRYKGEDLISGIVGKT